MAFGPLTTGGDRPPPRPRQPIPFFGRLPKHYHARESDLKALRAKLRSKAQAVGVRGMGGIGKTVIAMALALDDTVRADFPDGVAWITFGRDARPEEKAAELFRSVANEQTSFKSVSEAQASLENLTRDLALLIVLDDVWEPEAADPFARLGPRCRALITTRDSRVLTRAGADRHDVGLLDAFAARDFLSQVCGLPGSETLPPQAEGVIRQCGRLPLALAAAGGMIRDPGDWADVLAALEAGDAEVFDTSWLPDQEQRNLAVVLRVSIDRLPTEAKTCFLACAAFREDVNIPEATLIRLWSSVARASFHAKRIADELERRSLLIRDDRSRYRIHDLYVDYLRHAAAPLAQRHAQLVDRYREVCGEDWANCPDDHYILQHLPWHLQQAGLADELRNILFDFSWMIHKLCHTNINALIDDYRTIIDFQEAKIIADALILSSHVLSNSPEELAKQLHGRLFASQGPMIDRLLQASRDHCGLSPVDGPYLTVPGLEIRRFEGHTNWVWAVAMLADGRRAVSASDDKTLRLWDLETGAMLRTFKGHTYNVRDVAVLLDGRRAVSGSLDKTMRLWDLETGAMLRTFKGHTDHVEAVAVLQDGRRAVSASQDGT